MATGVMGGTLVPAAALVGERTPWRDRLGAMMLIWVVPGTVTEALSTVLLTTPVFFPIVMQLGVDPVWFSVLIVRALVVALVTVLEFQSLALWLPGLMK
jgi:TRAP-type C4-dicarboxylate transport system permease large subunit